MTAAIIGNGPQDYEYVDYSVFYHYALVDGLQIGYREAGLSNENVLLLVHGYPSSSRMYRMIIPILAKYFRVIAIDLPAFGFSSIPGADAFEYTFENYSELVSKFLHELGIQRASFYLFDYGAPILMRNIVKNPDMVQMIVFQNGNIYAEGVGDKLKEIKKLYDDNSNESDLKLNKYFELEYTRWEYLNGTKNKAKIMPETYYLDQFLLERPGVKAIQISLKRDYKTNIELYPLWQETLKKLQAPTLIVWGENDEVFKKEGAEMLHRDIPESKLIFYPTGHFALEEFGAEIAREIIAFWKLNFNM
ncbi:alpha/beta hydrolase [Flavobacterium psychroterrae]|uniref:Alpha/beta hydrolase n=1 Tax=Flavobacterium psychroterrae TaxID=2133767 RepID=A0ABS5PFJ4_9FLAO|nr:alpha/beta hydrolase [Flavobacterium psychroterrae]MBS7232615.1 alpha/beta hydrolase [Flavobacterium psychroterrae]